MPNRSLTAAREEVDDEIIFIEEVITLDSGTEAREEPQPPAPVQPPESESSSSNSKPSTSSSLSRNESIEDSKNEPEKEIKIKLDSDAESPEQPTSSSSVRPPESESSQWNSRPSPSSSLSRSESVEDYENEPEKETKKKSKSYKRKTSMIVDNQVLHLERGVVPPKGPNRTPFSFKEARKAAKPMKNPEKVQGKSAKNPLGLKLQMMENEVIGECRMLHVGPDFQTDVSKIPFFDLKDGDPYGSDEDHEVEIMKPLEEEKIPEKFQAKPELLFKTIQDQYWTPIFLQFKGRIPYEVALEHLKKCEFRIELALDTVDQKLKDVAQELKPLCVAQAMKLGKLVKSERNSMRKIQEQALRNFHLGEVRDHHRDFEKLYVLQQKNGVACTCHSMPHLDTSFEPRVSCTNCNRDYRIQTAHSNRLREREDQNKWCLICQVYFQMTKKRRPAEVVVFSEQEKTFLETWNRKEEEQHRKLSRAQVEEQIREENTQRWKRLELTEEEKDMVHLELQGAQHISGERVSAMLQPFHTPQFTKCQCSKNGGVTRKSQNFNKWTWTLVEQKKWRGVVADQKGDTMKIAKELNVEPGLVERFAKMHLKKANILKPRPMKPHHDLPTPIPTDEHFGIEQPTATELRQQRTAKRARYSD